MRALVLALALLCGSVQAMDKVPMDDAYALKAIASGECQKLPFGSGLRNGRGWVHSPIPGNVQVWMLEGGTVSTIGQPEGAEVVLDMRPGRQNPITTHPASPTDRLMWKVPGFMPGPVPPGFQLPP